MALWCGLTRLRSVCTVKIKFACGWMAGVAVATLASLAFDFVAPGVDVSRGAACGLTTALAVLAWLMFCWRGQEWKQKDTSGGSRF